MKKRILAFIFAATLMAIPSFPASASDAGPSPSGKTALSTLTTEEKLAFLKAQGVDVPSEYSRYVTSFISLLEENPDYPIIISNPVLYHLCEQTRDAVNNYYQRNGSQISSSDKRALSDMTTEEKLAFLQAQGVEVPSEYSRFITSFISLVEENPDYPSGISNPILYKLCEQAREAVNNYYQRDSSQISQAESTYILQDSTVYGSWSESFTRYNCYAYAVDRTDDFYWPGKFSNAPTFDDFNLSDPIYNLACDVKADLMSSSFSNQCVSITETRPTSLSSGQSCICIRKGPDDFHFMKLSSSSWYHKPGNSNPLKYNNVPSTSIVWTNEASFRGEMLPPTTYYDSTIYYLIYSKNHGSTTYTWTGNHYHSGSYHYYEYGYKCDTCGVFTSVTWTSMPCYGPPCATPWSLTPVPEVS